MSRQLDHLFATLVGEVTTAPIYQTGGIKRVSNMRLEIRNTMRVPVFWRNALGVVVTEPEMDATTTQEEFLITIEYEFHPGVKIDARELLHELNLPEKHVERKQIYERLTQLERGPMWHEDRRFHYTLGVSRQQLEEVGGVAYLNDVDLVIGFHQHKEAALHPYSAAGQCAAMSRTMPPLEGVFQHYVLVDNSGIYGSRWINTGYSVFELTPVRDPGKRDGAYVTVAPRPGQEEINTRYYSFEEAEKRLGLYRGRAEAEAFGSPDARFHAGIKELEQELAHDKLNLQQAKQEAERQKHELDEERRRHEANMRDDEDRRKREQAEIDAKARRDQAELDRQRELFQLERDRFNADREAHTERMRFEYDMRARDRKDQSETVKAAWDVAKAVLGLASVGLSLYTLVKKTTAK